MSPGFMPRPSLSGQIDPGLVIPELLVSPGFMPRPSLSVDARGVPAGVRPVSPGFMPRPSLSARGGVHALARADVCRRGSCPGLR